MRVHEVVNEDGTSRQVETAAGVRLPALVDAWADDVGGYDLYIHIANSGLRYECAEARLIQREGGPAVTSEALRTIKVKETVREALRQLLSGMTWMVTDAEGGQQRARLEEIEGVRPPQGVAVEDVSDEAIAWVAHIYELAYMLNDPPTKAVQEKFGVSRATAGRWVAEARRRNWLAKELTD
jgi:hypothetical protein